MSWKELPFTALVVYFFATGFFYMVNEQSFLPDPLFQALFRDKMFLGMSASGFFWLGAGIFLSIIFVYLFEASAGLLSDVYVYWRDGSWMSEGEEYLERHGVERFED